MFAILLALGIGYTLHAKDVFQPPKPPAPSKWLVDRHEYGDPRGGESARRGIDAAGSCGK
jgi:hypothetical protein